MSVPRLMIVSHHFAPSTGTVARRPTWLARFLAAGGQPPVVVTAAPGFYGEAVLPGRSGREDLEVHEVPYLRRHAIMERAGRLGRQALRMSVVLGYRRAIGRALESGPRPDFLFFCGAPFWYFPLARWFRTRRGIPYVLDLEDVWFMGGLPYRMGRRAGLRHVFDKVAEARSIGGASLVVLTTEAQTEFYRQRYDSLPADLFITVPWGYDAEALGSVRPARRERSDTFRLAIFGKFAAYGSQDAAALAEAVAALHVQSRVEVMHLGEPEPELADAFRRQGLSMCFREPGMLPYADGLAILASADCLALNAISDVSLPVKVYDYIGMNRPVLAFAAAESALGRLLSRFEGAFLVQTAGQASQALGVLAQRRLSQLQPGLDTTQFSQHRQFECLVHKLSDLLERHRAEARGLPCA